jgi:hypothetical protein
MYKLDVLCFVYSVICRRCREKFGGQVKLPEQVGKTEQVTLLAEEVSKGVSNTGKGEGMVVTIQYLLV